MNKNLTTWLTVALLVAEGSLIDSSNAWAGRRRRHCCTQPAACCAPAPNCCSATSSFTAYNSPVGAAQATAAPAPVPTEEKQSLYTRLGGEPAIKAVMDDFVG